MHSGLKMIPEWVVWPQRDLTHRLITLWAACLMMPSQYSLPPDNNLKSFPLACPWVFLLNSNKIVWNFLISLEIQLHSMMFFWKLSYERILCWSRHIGRSLTKNKHVVFFWKQPRKRVYDVLLEWMLEKTHDIGKGINISEQRVVCYWFAMPF